MVYCCIPLCKSSGRTAASRGISFHEFPVTDVRNLWLKNIHRQAEGPGKQPWLPNDRSKVCSLHFRPEDYRESTKYRRLKPDAAPTLFPDFPTYLQPAPSQPRRPAKRKRVSLDCPKQATKHRQEQFFHDVPSDDGILADTADDTAGITAHAEDSVNAPQTLTPEPDPQPPSQTPPHDLVQRTCSFSFLPSTSEPALKETPRPVSVRPKPTKSTQTRMSLSRMALLLKQVTRLTRKCRLLARKKNDLQEEVSGLKREARKVNLAMEKANLVLLQEKVEQNEPKALFIQEQLAFLGVKKGRWREETIRNCVLWHSKSPAAYRLIRESGLLALPCRSTLKRYIGACTGEVVSSLIKQRLHMEAKVHSEKVTLPVGYYFTKALTGQQLEHLALNVMQSVEDAGFRVVRLVGDNHKSNTKFFSSLSGGQIQPVVEHPLDAGRPLFLSFDYCHIIKNIRSQFLDAKKIFRNQEKLILPDFLRLLHKTQESQGAFKLVRCLTEKHLSPSNFEKMNVRRAVDIFSVQVTSVLRFLQQHGHRLGANGFQNCLPTLEFMEVVQKWFALHNIKSTTLHWTSRDALRMPFYSADDERLLWLETECLQYFAQWKESTLHKKEFLSEETYEALRVTTLSTVLCTRHLLQLGFYFVLTGKFSSDDVESLFSAIRQLNGSNDLTDAYAALSALQKILTTGIIHSSESGNVRGVVAPLGEVPALPVEPVKQAATGTDIRKLLLPHLATLERYPCPPQQSLRSSTLALIAGFLVRAIQDNIECEGCLVKLQAPSSSSPTTALIAGIGRGGLSYPTLPFVGFVHHLEQAASRVASVLVKGPQPLKKFSAVVLPSLLKSPLFDCAEDKSVPHKTKLVSVILQKFMRPFLSNTANGLTVSNAKKKALKTKPTSRKVLKV
ncbi:hypothetical protein HPB51_028602 [Rhipicephalus microplus]|uniref:THAP-type domain-containing protein n=1 Tax=Rhipicephalus microplus TaxID=6941 RepID=A0A9J6CWL6_RHIMP|nr:hypothetical protein HPB51_028602 [Rhipicephalus microplus]